jgi:transcriptional regulator with XRE-family HTH domain
MVYGDHSSKEWTGLSTIVYAAYFGSEERGAKPMEDNALGRRLAEVRGLRSLSLKAVAVPAGISAAYLQKLERGQVKNPSPNILYALAQELKVPYSELMKLAGYVVPRGARDRTPVRKTNLLAHALSSEDLTEDEAQAVARYLAWYRHEQASRGG